MLLKAKSLGAPLRQLQGADPWDPRNKGPYYLTRLVLALFVRKLQWEPASGASWFRLKTVYALKWRFWP